MNMTCIVLLMWDIHALRGVAKMFDGNNVVKPLVLEPFKGPRNEDEDEDEDKDENENNDVFDWFLR